MCWENHTALASFDVTWDWGQREQVYTEVKLRLPRRKGRDRPCQWELPKSLCPQTITILVTLGSLMLARGLGSLSNQLGFFSFSSDRIYSPDYPLIHNAGQTDLKLPICQPPEDWVCVSMPSSTGFATMLTLLFPNKSKGA